MAELLDKVKDEIDEILKGHPEILPRSLPKILDEMDENIRTIAEATRRAEGAARVAREAAIAATKASEEAGKRAVEAGHAGVKAAETATRAAEEAGAKAEATARAGRLAAEEAGKKAEEANEAARKAVGEFRKAANQAAMKAEKASSRAIKASKEVLNRIESLEQRLKDIEESIPREAVVVIREISREEAKTEIERLFAEGKTLYYSDIAKELRLDLELVVDICEELVKEEKVKVAENS